MKVKLGQAVKIFFGNASLEMVYFEAIANSLDAEADIIDIKIYLDAFNESNTLKIEISDNGLGFTDDRYTKFSRLFDVDESSHKGLGRLVYLCYFDTVQVSSTYEQGKKRDFVFSENFKEENSTVTKSEISDSGSTFTMTGYTLQKIAKNEYINPKDLKNRILEEFYPRLFSLKQTNQEIVINIETKIGDKTYSDSLRNSEIPNLEFVELDASINLLDKFILYYSIEKVDDLNDNSFISAISVDNRTFKVDIVDKENTPIGYKMVFLLFSDFFRGKVDLARQNLTITAQELKNIQHVFRKKVALLIEERVPVVRKNNQQIRNNLVNTYPHLSGYFNEENIGYLKRNDILKNAQDEFFKAQKELLEAKSLDDEQFKKSLDISARALTEYILFRQLTINRLKNSDSDNSEAELHKMFADMGKDGKFLKEDTINDLYRNNAWLLDDKYMTYEVTLSNREMTELVTYITEGEVVEKDADRPDLAFIFSNNPKEDIPFDVVIVELKKRGVGLYENMKAVTQLEKRARSLMKYYNNKIQRIWYYGIIEFDDETELNLKGEYTQLYSTGKMYYKETKIATSLDSNERLPIAIFMWDIDAIVNDANARNQTFLNFIKSKFTK